MGNVDVVYGVELGFTPASQVYADPDRPPLFRARARDATPYEDDGVERHVCEAVDWLHDDSVAPDLFTFGFDCVDLAAHADLQATLAGIYRSGRITDESAAALRAALDGAALTTSSGRKLTVVYVADEGLIMRTGLPNRMSGPQSSNKSPNGHRPAVSVHADQDVYGTPVRQLMDGRAPTLFRHDSPDGHNHDASLMLVNMWIPFHQITQPLVLADGRSVDRLQHQLLYGLPTDTFLDRDDDQNVNDIWAFRHDPAQRWYFRSEMDHASAYLFNTLSTPHSAATLPGEEVAERGYRALEAVEAAMEAGDQNAVERAVAEASDIEPPPGATPALREAIAEMIALLGEAADVAVSPASDLAAEWIAEAKTARARVVRSSVELRVVVSDDA